MFDVFAIHVCSSGSIVYHKRIFLQFFETTSAAATTYEYCQYWYY